MRMPTANLAAVLILAAASSAAAQSSYLWEELGSSEGMTVSYNPLTVRHADGQITFLEKVSYADPVPVSNGEKMSYYTVEMTIACAADTYAHANFTVYGGDGKVIPNVNDPTPAGMNSIPADGAPIAFKTKFCE